MFSIHSGRFFFLTALLWIFQKEVFTFWQKSSLFTYERPNPNGYVKLKSNYVGILNGDERS